MSFPGCLMHSVCMQHQSLFDMDSSDVEPNRNADAYRNYQPNQLPTQIEKYIDFVEICEDGFMLLGCSNLTGRFWAGSLWYFIEPDAAPDPEKCLTCVDFETGVTDGKFLEDKQKVIVCEDSGAVQILGLTESAEEHSFHFEPLYSVCEHDDSVLSVSVFSDKKQAVTGGADMNIKVWNLESLMSEQTYRPAHVHQVLCVCAQPEGGNSIFASCSFDGTALIWDTRNPKPAQVAWFDRAKLPTSLSWHTTKDNILAIGTNVGEVSILDTRQLKIPIGETICFNRPLHRLRFASHKPDWLSACADDTKVKVLDCSVSSPTIMYTDDRHDDFVRGLAWHDTNETLYSCGWDKQVFIHKIPLSPAKMEVNGVLEEKHEVPKQE